MIPHLKEGHTWIRNRLKKAMQPAFFFDFDGTLSPIVSRPEEARFPREMKDAMGRLLKTSRVAVISGRPVRELRSRISLPIWLIGNHGLEERSPKGTTQKTDISRYSKNLQEVCRNFRTLAREIPGSQVEWKQFSVTFHYRNVKKNRVSPLREKINQILKDHPQLELQRGKKVFEVRIHGIGNKGTAVQRLRKQWKSDFTAYFGDDITDEDGFRKLGKEDLPVRVGFLKRETAARYYVRTPREVRQAIDFLAEVLNGK